MKRSLFSLLLLCAVCGKVPLVATQTRFEVAEASWFEDEETLFLFYRITADQGIGPEAQVEVFYRTDTVEQPWTPVERLPAVHTHLAVECGANARCGSSSVRLSKPPQQVVMRLRYHREGALAKEIPVQFHVVGKGPPSTHRSLLVYGVFEKSNQRVQWRARHQFPALRNEQVEELGLRRSFRVTDPGYGDTPLSWKDNPYGYGFDTACPGGFIPFRGDPVETDARAVFAESTLPKGAADAPLVCATVTIQEAPGPFQTVALARKNPDVRPAFPTLRSPVRKNTPLPFLLRPCDRTISKPHLAMQIQRLQLEHSPEICLDRWQEPGFVQELVSRFRTEIQRQRPNGKDMLFVLALHHDDARGQLAGRVEEALEQVLVPERGKSSPRVTGAFVFDSFVYTPMRPQLKPLVLWYPVAETSGMPDLELGPFRIGSLPILPTRARHLKFLETYSEAQAGKMKEFHPFAPERTPTSENVPMDDSSFAKFFNGMDDFSFATFFNGEVFTAEPSDAFSYCPSPEAHAVLFRTVAGTDPLPLSQLPTLHQESPQRNYSLGLLWDLPFLIRAKYETVVAGSVRILSFSVPFPLNESSSNTSELGSPLWKEGVFPLHSTLLQCTRFCDHPTFDAAGVYNVQAPFRSHYADQCYTPLFPRVGDGGFPRDP